MVAPNDREAAAYLNRGIALSHARLFGQAVADLTRAIEHGAVVPRAYLERARAHTHRGSLDEALEDLARALELDPRNALAYAYRGIVHRLRGNLNLALADLGQALRLDPKRILAGWDLGLSEIARRRNPSQLSEAAESRPFVHNEHRSNPESEEVPEVAERPTAVESQPAEAIQQHVVRVAAEAEVIDLTDETAGTRGKPSPKTNPPPRRALRSSAARCAKPSDRRRKRSRISEYVAASARRFS
jgi:tetratricopeptide (TPR) repeat protein